MLWLCPEMCVTIQCWYCALGHNVVVVRNHSVLIEIAISIVTLRLIQWRPYHLNWDLEYNSSLRLCYATVWTFLLLTTSSHFLAQFIVESLLKGKQFVVTMISSLKWRRVK